MMPLKPIYLKDMINIIPKDEKEKLNHVEFNQQSYVVLDNYLNDAVKFISQIINMVDNGNDSAAILNILNTLNTLISRAVAELNAEDGYEGIPFGRENIQTANEFKNVLMWIKHVILRIDSEINMALNNINNWYHDLLNILATIKLLIQM